MTMASTTNTYREEGVLARLSKGDKDAFKWLYERYSAKLYINIRSILKDEDAAQEVLQEVFIRLWNYRERIDPHKSFQALLYKTGKNLVYNYLRNRWQGRAVLGQFVDEMVAYQHVEERLFHKETSAMLDKAIEELPPQRKLVFKLCKLEGKSYGEVSEMLDISISTISDHIVKATRAIKAKLRLHDISV